LPSGEAAIATFDKRKSPAADKTKDFISIHPFDARAEIRNAGEAWLDHGEIVWWLFTAERARLPIPQRAPKPPVCGGNATFSQGKPHGPARVHVRFIASFKLPFKSSPDDRPARTKSPRKGRNDRSLGAHRPEK
jgi:hypothetical protein